MEEFKFSLMPYAQSAQLLNGDVDPLFPVIMRSGDGEFHNYRASSKTFAEYILETIKTYGFITLSDLDKKIASLHLELYITSADVLKMIDSLNISLYATKSELEALRTYLLELLQRLLSEQDQVPNYNSIKAYYVTSSLNNTFDSGYKNSISTPPSGWSLSASSLRNETTTTQYLWMIEARLTSNGFYKWLDGSIWSTATCLGMLGKDGKDGKDGADGADGADGIDGSNGTDIYRQYVQIFISSQNRPDTPEGGTYNFETNKLTKLPYGWSSSYELLVAPVWTSYTTFVTSTTNTGWSYPTRFIKDGSELLMHAKAKDITIYINSSSVPTTPSGGTYDFDTNEFKNCPTYWSQTLTKANTGLKTYYSNRSFYSDGSSSAWTTPAEYNSILAGDYTKTKVILIYSASKEPCTSAYYDFETNTCKGLTAAYSTENNLNFLYYFIVTFYSDNTSSWSTYIPTAGSYYEIDATLFEIKIIYKESDSTPAKPSGGNYSFTSKTFTCPDGWQTDALTGDNAYYSMRVFYKDGLETDWSDPSPVSTGDIDITALNYSLLADKINFTTNLLNIMAKTISELAEFATKIYRNLDLSADSAILKFISANITAEQIDISAVAANISASDSFKTIVGDNVLLELTKEGNINLIANAVNASGQLNANGLLIGTGSGDVARIIGPASNYSSTPITFNGISGNYYECLGAGYLAGGNLRWLRGGSTNGEWNVFVTGNINATSGKIGGWNIGYDSPNGNSTSTTMLYAESKDKTMTMGLSPSEGIYCYNSSTGKNIFALNAGTGNVLFCSGDVIFSKDTWALGNGTTGIYKDKDGIIHIGSGVKAEWATPSGLTNSYGDSNVVSLLNNSISSTTIQWDKILTPTLESYSGTFGGLLITGNLANYSSTLSADKGIMWLTTWAKAKDISKGTTIQGLSEGVVLNDLDPVILLKRYSGDFFVLSPLLLNDNDWHLLNNWFKSLEEAVKGNLAPIYYSKNENKYKDGGSEGAYINGYRYKLYTGTRILYEYGPEGCYLMVSAMIYKSYKFTYGVKEETPIGYYIYIPYLFISNSYGSDADKTTLGWVNPKYVNKVNFVNPKNKVDNLRSRIVNFTETWKEWPYLYEHGKNVSLTLPNEDMYSVSSACAYTSCIPAVTNIIDTITTIDDVSDIEYVFENISQNNLIN